MRIKNIVDEDFLQYSKCSMFIGTAKCTFKCCKEAGCDVCQNSALANAPTIDIHNYQIVSRYMDNKLTSAVVVGGMEPFDQWEELRLLIWYFRAHTNDDIVIYTGYNKDEIINEVKYLIDHFWNITIKFGRFIPNSNKRYDEVLGVWLASDNQYAEKIC